MRLVVLLLLALAGVAAGHGTARACESFLPLTVLLGPWAHVWTGLLFASLVAIVAAAGLEVRGWRRGEPRTLAPLRAFLVCAVLGSVTFLACWQPFERLWFEMWAGVTAGVFAASLLVGRRRSEDERPAWSRKLDFVLFNLCLALLLAEVGLRVAASITPTPLLSQKDIGSWQFMERFRLAPGQLHGGFPANSGGHYDEEFTPKRPGEPVVAVVGDSFSVGSVHHLLHYTTVAERSSGLRFDNYGYAGIGPREYRELILHAILPREPDAVVLSLFLGNDLSLEPMLSPQLDRALRGWFDLENVLAWQVPRRLAKIRAVGEAGRDPDEVRLHTLEEVHAGHPWTLDPSLEISPRSLDSHLEIETHRAWSICRHLDSYDELMDILASIEEAAYEVLDVPFGVMIIPDEFQVEDPLWDRVLDQRGGSDELERFRTHRELHARFDEAGLPYLDLLPLLRAQPTGPDGLRHLYHLGDTHFNARGNEVAGEALAGFVEQLLGR